MQCVRDTVGSMYTCISVCFFSSIFTCLYFSFLFVSKKLCFLYIKRTLSLPAATWLRVEHCVFVDKHCASINIPL